MKKILLFTLLLSNVLFSQSWYIIDPATITGTLDFSDFFSLMQIQDGFLPAVRLTSTKLLMEE